MRSEALRPRRRAAGDDERPALLGDQARVVARVALVLVGRVVLLVDDDQPEPLDRREHRRARADAHARLAAAQAQPLVEALAVAERRVQDRDGVAEALDEPRHDLRRQRDLGHEHDRALAALQRRTHGAQVDLGLARAGDAVQQQPLVGGEDAGQRRLLVGSQGGLGLVRADHHVLRARAAAPAGTSVTKPPLLQPPQRRQVRAGQPRQRLQQRALRVGQASVGLDALRPQRRLLAHPRRRQHQARPPGRRWSSTPWPSSTPARTNSGGSDCGNTRRGETSFSAGTSVWSTSPTTMPEHVAPAERHLQQRADADRRRGQVVERPAQRAGRGERLHAGDPRHRPSVRPYAASAFSAAALSVFSQVKSWSSRPKWPYAAVFW